MRFIKAVLPLLVAIAVLCALCSCNTDKEKKEKVKSPKDSFIIIHSSEPIDVQIAHTVASMLNGSGRSARTFESQLPKGEDEKAPKAIITVGRSVMSDASPDNGIPHIYCLTDGGGEIDSKKGISPTLDSAALADCAMVLLPEAENFSVISSKEGGSDVQSACDLLDRTGKNYTVESLDGRIYGEVLLSCLESDTDALILPAGAAGNKNASAAALPYIPESDVPVIAVGTGEPIKGALATFCIDSSAMSEALYSLVISEVYGTDATLPDSYYVLCINKERAAALDERAKKNVAELFCVVWVE